MDSLSSKQFGKYYVQGSCGAGGMGTVFRARDMDLNRMVALKVIHPHLVRQQNFYERFIEEARLIAHLDHPNIVKIYDFSTTRDPLYFVMPFYTGNLKLFLGRQRERRVPEAQAVALMVQVAHALHYAHAERIVHGDIKPENILIQMTPHMPPDREPVQAVLADFGLATLLEADSEATPAFMGSWAYMAPERIEGELNDGRSDLYALGITLYQLLVGRPPFEIKTLQDALQMHAHALPPLDHEAIGPEVKEILQKALAKRPEERYQTGLEFAEALQQMMPLSFGMPMAFPNDNSMETLIALPTDDEDISGDAATEILTMSPDATAQVIGGGKLQDGDFIVVNRIASRLYSIQDKDVIRIGRSESNDIKLEHPGITAEHATLRRTAEGWEVRDLKSTNGVYLDNDRLLPDQQEEWKVHQQLRIGPFNLELRVPNSGQRSDNSKILASLEPSPILDDMRPGEERIAHIRFIGQGIQRDYYQIEVEGLPSEWYRLPQSGLPIAPNEEAQVLVYFTPPANQKADAYPFQIRIRSLVLKRESKVISGQLNIDPAPAFQVIAHPDRIVEEGSCVITIHNQGNVSGLYTIRNIEPEQGQNQRVRFGVLPDNVYAVNTHPTASSSADSEPPQSLGTSVNQVSTSPLVTTLRRYLPAVVFENPLVRAYRVGRVYQQRAGQVRRDIGRFAGSWPDKKELRQAQFAYALRQQIEIPAGESREVEFLVQTDQKKQKIERLQKISLEITDTELKQARLKEIELVTPAKQTSNWVRIFLPFLVVILLISLCIGSYFVVRSVDSFFNLNLLPTPSPFPEDQDGDGILTVDELRRNLNPQNPDTDGDRIPDNLDEYPLTPDADANGVLDGFDLTPSPTISSAQTAVQTPIPDIPLAPTPQLIILSFESGDNEFLIVGDDGNNIALQPTFSLDIPFDSAAQIDSAALIFTENRIERRGDIEISLGNIYIQPYVNGQSFEAAIVLRPIPGEPNAQRWQANLSRELLSVMAQNKRVEFVLFAENPTDLDGEIDQLFLYTEKANRSSERPVLLVNSRSE